MTDDIQPVEFFRVMPAGGTAYLASNADRSPAGLARSAACERDDCTLAAVFDTGRCLPHQEPARPRRTDGAYGGAYLHTYPVAPVRPYARPDMPAARPYLAPVPDHVETITVDLGPFRRALAAARALAKGLGR